MRVASKMVALAMGLFTCIGANAQVDCSDSSVTKLVCLVPYNTGAPLQKNNPQAITTTQIFNGPLGSQLSQLPLATSASGAVTLTNHGNPESYDNLGPVFVDRPDSVGKGHFVIGFSAQQFRFNHLDGISIGSIPVVYPEDQANQTYQQTVHASVKYNQYVLIASYGLPQKIDFSVVVPITRISIGVSSINPMLYTATTPDGTPIASGSAHGSASGPGDVVLSAKRVLWSGGDIGKGSLAAGFALRLPSGDALNYLGSGAYGFNPYVLAAYKAKFTPHLKIGYQWNTNSVLLNVGGIRGADRPLPGGLQAAVGADYRISKQVTLSGDFLSNQFQNSPSIVITTYMTVSGASVQGTQVRGAHTVASVKKTFTTANFSGGLKWKPFSSQNLVLYGNVLIQMNDVGLRSDPSPSGGISYNFPLPKTTSKTLSSPDH